MTDVKGKVAFMAGGGSGVGFGPTGCKTAVAGIRDDRREEAVKTLAGPMHMATAEEKTIPNMKKAPSTACREATRSSVRRKALGQYGRSQ